MQIRHAKPGDEAQLAFLLEDNQRHYGHAVEDGAGAADAAHLVEPSPGSTMCLVADDGGKLVGRLGMRREKKVYYVMDV